MERVATKNEVGTYFTCCHLLHYHGGLLGSYQRFRVIFAFTSSLKMNLGDPYQSVQ